MMLMRVLSVITMVIAVTGCDGVATKSVPNTQGTDRIWAHENTYCARKLNGLICWEANRDNITSLEPTVFDGVGKVEALALRQGEGCAMSELGLGCFRLADKQLARGSLAEPRGFVAFGTPRPMFCARSADGVSCFQDKIENLAPMPAFGKPNELHATLGGTNLCAEYEHDVRCFTTDPTGALLATVRVRGVRGAKSIRVSQDPGWVLVLDGDGLKLATVASDVVKGRPTVGDHAKDFPDALALEPERVESVKGAKKLTADATSVYVLDDEGVKSLEMTPNGLAVQLWPMEGNPTAMWQGKGAMFFTEREGEMRVHGWKGEERFIRRLRGIKNPRDVAVGEHHSCVVHDGGVACVRNVMD